MFHPSLISLLPPIQNSKFKIQNFLLLLLLPIISFAQRNYAPNSVLHTGNWFRVAVDTGGVYRVDAELLREVGYKGGGFPAVKIFGKNGAMLPEACNGPYTDDLVEIPVRRGDGFVLFYSPGPHRFKRDPTGQGFRQHVHLYTDYLYYYVQIAGGGTEMSLQPVQAGPDITVTEFDDLRFRETESVNFLGSGKEWYGEEFASAPGKRLSQVFDFSFPGRNMAEPVRFRAELAARSVQGASRFRVTGNGANDTALDVPPVGGGAYDPFASEQVLEGEWRLAQQDIRLEIGFQPGGFNAQGWLNRLALHARSALRFSGGTQWHFRDERSVGKGNAEFEIAASGGEAEVWEVTDPLQPRRMRTTLQNGVLRFTNNTMQLREYIAFIPALAARALPAGAVPNQNLHGGVSAQMLIVSAPELLGEARSLADYHAGRDGIQSLIVTPEQVYHEFSAGVPDPTAIRDFVKMHYDRAAGNTSREPRYLLLMGDASFDYKNRISGNTNLVPAYESVNSLEPLATYTSDDFFGFLDHQEDINSQQVINELDIAVGRIPAASPEEARAYVDKIMEYHGPDSFGAWRNELCFVADDEDGNLHLNDAEYVSEGVEAIAPGFLQQKIYMDAFPQESTPAGSRYPAASRASNDHIQNGTLIWNYSGHGGYTRLAEEVILDKAIAAGWNNRFRYPLMITATCDFAPYDNPGLPSLGEQVLLQPRSGAIALMTTTRPVFAFSNRTMNYNYLRESFQKKADGNYPSLGEAVRKAKNFSYRNSGDVLNNRKFTLLGDPALTLAFPRENIRTLSVNGRPVSSVPDTARALEKIEITGEITDVSGNRMLDFKGILNATVFDKKENTSTLGNDPGSQVTSFQQWERILYKGKTSVENGMFRFEFVVPKDIDYTFGEGRISYYAENGETDAAGYYDRIMVGGGSENSLEDETAPELKAWMNDEKFVNGSITNAAPILLVRIADSSGINTSGTGIGHDITAVLDNDVNNPIVLNDFYEAEQDTYKRGRIRYQLPELEPGEHQVRIRAWDVANNPGEYLLEFRVAETEELVLEHVLNYPNPFTTRTNFWFEHNRPFENLRVELRVFSLAGKLVKSLRSTIFTTGNRSIELEWNGRDDFGARIGRGVYWYRLRVTDARGNSREVVQKLVVL